MTKKRAMFQFYDPGYLIDGDLTLILTQTTPANPIKGYVPAYTFKMTIAGQTRAIGRIQLRVGNTHHILMYGGHIGYEVAPAYRGRRYAARSCQLLLPLAQQHGLQTIWITCNPDNIASKRTCELIGAEFVEIVDLPADSDMYQNGERQKCRYRLNLAP